MPQVSRPAYCGRYGITLANASIGGSWARNFEGTVGLEDGMTTAGWVRSCVLKFALLLMPVL